MSGFTEWFENNRESEHLWDQYQNAKSDIEYTGERPPTFRQFCKEVYEEEIGI